MNELTLKVLKGAATGFVVALGVDINAWAKANGPAFDWGLAVKRWLAGAVGGALSAFGLSGVTL